MSPRAGRSGPGPHPEQGTGTSWEDPVRRGHEGRDLRRRRRQRTEESCLYWGAVRGRTHTPEEGSCASLH